MDCSITFCGCMGKQMDRLYSCNTDLLRHSLCETRLHIIFTVVCPRGCESVAAKDDFGPHSWLDINGALWLCSKTQRQKIDLEWPDMEVKINCLERLTHWSHTHTHTHTQTTHHTHTQKQESHS